MYHSALGLIEIKKKRSPPSAYWERGLRRCAGAGVGSGSHVMRWPAIARDSVSWQLTKFSYGEIQWNVIWGDSVRCSLFRTDLSTLRQTRPDTELSTTSCPIPTSSSTHKKNEKVRFGLVLRTSRGVGADPSTKLCLISARARELTFWYCGTQSSIFERSHTLGGRSAWLVLWTVPHRPF